MSIANHGRASGVLLHPTSLPAPREGAPDAGSGEFGAAAREFVDWLAEAGQSLWQVLPFNPVGPGASPYTSPAARAGNPLLVSLVALADERLLDREALAQACAQLEAAPGRADFGEGARLRTRLLHIAAQRFFTAPAEFAELHVAFRAWCAAERGWLDDYALFMALRESLGEGRAWPQWPADLARRDPGSLRTAADVLSAECDFWRFVQWCCARQWRAIREYAREHGVRIIGDLPIYVAWDSVDVWVRPELFQLDPGYRPTAVAGVPPDYFSADGQLWGNPLYRWERHAEEGFAWWRARLDSALAFADLVRIDHFRALESYWRVPAGARTAVEGEWVPGPGIAFFTALEQHLGAAHGALPLVAEDLGTITADVRALRRAAGLPGMRVLQFGFGSDAEDLNLPHNLPEDCAVFTGTHDNDTTLGWFEAASTRERDFARIYLKTDGHEIGWDLIHAASASTARYSLYPMQDVLSQGGEARMNTPGLADGQWSWRMQWSQLDAWRGRRLRQISAVHGRNGVALDDRVGL
ncbi:MAG: 4-alpha-glucanotransferase [Gammaproteobacteria bacterium]